MPYGQGNHHPSICPYGLFHCQDGLVQIAVGSEGLWRRLAPAFDLPLDAPGFATNVERVRNREVVNAAIDAAFAAYPLDRLLPLLDEIAVPAGEVRALDWEQTRSQGLIIEVEHASAGRIRLPGPPLRFEGSPPLEHTAPPTLGQHDESVRRWLDDAEPA